METVSYYPQLTNQTQFDAVILAGGTYPKIPLALRLLVLSPYVCCCDSAGQSIIEQGLMPNAIVGDGDSLSDEIKEKYSDIVHIINEQDDNDLTKATKHCIVRGFSRILYLGTTGKREDHTLANISLMMRYKKEFAIESILLSNDGYFTPACGKAIFQTKPGQQISIFNFGSTILKGRGFRWQPYTYTELWQGTLNEAIGNEVEIMADKEYMIYRVL